MITCSRCGAEVPAGLASCQKCGMSIDGIAGKGNQDQPLLPAWLETLRADRRPAPASSSAPFPAANMPNESAVPDWMRSGSLESAGATPPSAFPAPRPAATPAPNTDGVFMQANMSANSLIDEQSLPSWLREAQDMGPRAPQDNIAASSLIQQESLPNWMKTIPPAPAPAQPATSVPAQPAQPFMAVPQGPIAGSDLIDPQALPQWMTNQPGSVAPAPGERFSASSLLDANALPPWMRDAGQQQSPHVGTPSFPPMPPAQPTQAAPMPPVPGFNGQPPMPVQNTYGPPPQPDSGLAANSLIDMGALPDWLRSAEEQQRYAQGPQQPGMAGAPAPFGAPGRAGNMRVPGRPRSDMGVGPQEDSAIAANVFSSVLGVASAAPPFPAQGPFFAPSQPMNGAGSAPFAQGMPPTMQNNAPAQGMPGGPGMGAYPTYPVPPSVGQPPAGYQGNMNASSQPGAMPSYPGTGPGMQPEPSTAREPAKPAKPARRSIFDALRDWLSRN